MSLEGPPLEGWIATGEVGLTPEDVLLSLTAPPTDIVNLHTRLNIMEAPYPLDHRGLHEG